MRTPSTCIEWAPSGQIRSKGRHSNTFGGTTPVVGPTLGGAPAPAAGPGPGAGPLVAPAPTAAPASGVPETLDVTSPRVVLPERIASNPSSQLEEVRWEATLNRIVGALLVIVMVLVAAAWPLLGTGLALPLVLLCLAFAAYCGISWLTLENGASRAFRFLRRANVTVEASLGTLAIAVIAVSKGPAWAMTSGTVLLYALALVTASARMNPRLCLYATALIVVQHLGVYYLIVEPALTPALVEHVPSLRTIAVWERSLWLAAAGGVATLVTRQAQRRVMLGEVQAAQRRWLEKEFGRYVSPDVVSAILRGEAALGRAERREVTVLFCDLRDFTPICEREPPENVVRLLNEFFGQACKIVEAHGGTVNKFFGDGVLALFGAPDEHPNHAPAAAEAAHELVAATAELRTRGGIWENFDVGIGIDTGDVVVGPIGAPNRVEYTAIGATVNRAARLQSLSRAARRRIILSETSVRSLGPRANVVALGEVSLKGFSTPEPVFAFRHS